MKKNLVLFASLLALTACNSQKTAAPVKETAPAPSAAAPAPTTAPAPAAAPVSAEGAGDPNKAVAEINGVVISEAELNKEIDSRLTRVRTQIYEIQRQGIGNLINTRLLEEEAKKQNIPVQELVKKEVTDKVGEVTDKEIQDFFTLNQAKMKDKTLDQVKDSIKQQLVAQKSMTYRNNFLDRLREKANVKILLTRPTIDVSVDDDPMQGNKDAKVTIIEFTDYQCPFCTRAKPVVKQIMDTYKDKVRFVLRDFPLDFHPLAKKAAEAAQCAHDQNKYWEYGDILWDNQKALDIANLKSYAGQLKLDQKKFDECLDSGKYTAEVAKDQADGAKAGVSGTPAFFINGQMITGARPFEQFKEIIDMELMQAK